MNTQVREAIEMKGQKNGIYQKGKNWYIDYCFYGRRRREMVGPSKKLAEAALHKRKLQIAEGKYLDIDTTKKMRFDAFANEYLELHSKLKRSYYTDEKIIDLLKKYFGNLYLHEITSLDIEKFKSERIKKVSPATVNRALAVLKSMFNRAIEWKNAKENPCKSVKLFKENNQRLRYLEQEEIKQLLNNSKGYIRAIVITALFTGMRKSEILNLKWNNCDFNRSLIRLTYTKNNEVRTIPIDKKLREILIAVPKHPDSPYIFSKKNGQPFGNIRKSFDKLLETCKIREFRFHDLRHTYASQLVMSGVDLNTVRELLGHKSLQMTLRYAHLSPDHKRRAIDALSNRMDTIWSKNNRNSASLLPPEGLAEKSDNFGKSQFFENTAVT